jgi:hypothetical protein
MTPEPTRPMPDLCEACSRPRGETRLHLDHDHVTGVFRGWLCRQCNLGLGLLGDNKERVLKILNYLGRCDQ